MRRVVIMQNDMPIGVMNDLCYIKFHSFVKAFSSERGYKSVPMFVPNSDIYSVTSQTDSIIYFKAVEVMFVS